MEQQIVSKWLGGMSFNTETIGGSIKLDADEITGGKGNGVRPKALMLVALSGCTSMDVASLLKKMRVEVDGFKVVVTGELTDEHPKFYHKVKVFYQFTGNDIDKEKVEKAVNLSLDRYCGVYEMFRKFSNISFEINYNKY
jgi:putative redox protein